MNDRVIQVLVVDDHGSVRRGLRFVLDVYDDLALAGEATNGKEAVELCRVLQPDVVLMDLHMPEMGGVTAARIIRRKFPQIAVVALTSFNDSNLRELAAQAGIDRFLPKTVPVDELVNTIRTVAGSLQSQ
jgi:DNA-binding NarL/FixJ family response regulator